MNKTGLTTPASIIAVVILASVMYVWRLGNAPIYLTPDEAITAVDAYSLARSGRDVQGHLLPLYLQIQMPGEDPMGWSTPAIMYLSAFFLKIFPLSEGSARLSSAAVGIADVVLLYLLARGLLKSGALALFASGLLAITPAHFMLSRYALDYEYPLPFILGWLLGLHRFLETGKTRALVIAVACLGVGFYSYNSAVFMMPLYFGFTLLLLFKKKESARLYGLVALVFMLPLSGLFVWVWVTDHLSIFTEAVQHYSLYDTRHLNPLEGIASFLSHPNIERRASLYWSFFNPSFLFLSGSSQIIFSTRQVGVFLWPVSVLLALGIYDVLGSKRTPMNILVLAGFFTGPLAATLVPEPGTIIRAMPMVPFGVLLATFGFERLWSTAVIRRPSDAISYAGIGLSLVGMAYASYRLVGEHRPSSSAAALILIGAGVFWFGKAGGRPRRLRQGSVVAGCLVAAMLIQFAHFWVDYFGDYRVRSAPWLSGNLRGALEALIELDAREHVPQVYLGVLRSEGGLMDIRNRWMEPFWRFYVFKHGREDLLTRTTMAFELVNSRSVPARSLLLANAGDKTAEQMIRNGELRLVQLIPEVQHPPFFTILQR